MAESAGWDALATNPDSAPLAMPAGAAGAQGVLPTHIGPYLVEGLIARGGMGVVYRARHRATGLPAAVKTVRLRSEAHLTSIRRELHALAGLRHPGVVRTIDQGIERDLPWYAMELLVGETLADWQQHLWEGAPTPSQAACGRLAEVLTVARRLCAPLGFLHGEGVIHADLKPANVFLRPDGRPVLVDFGISRRFGARGREVPDLPALGGTPAFMSPQHQTGELLEARDDLYSLGCILYALLTGRPPFLAGSDVGVALQHLNTPPAAPSSLVEGVPPALDRLVLSLLAKQRRDRPGHADDVAEILEELGAAHEEARPEKRRAFLYRPGLIGREGPLRELLALMEGLRSGSGAVALIAGESGIGKTYLALEVSRRAAQRNVRVLNASCLPTGAVGLTGGGAALHPFRELLLAVADRCASEGRAATERLLGNRAAVLAAIEPRLALSPGLGAPAEPPVLDGAAARDRLLAAMVETIAAFAFDEPLLFVIDDLQWADELTLLLIKLLASEGGPGAPLLLLCTHRTDEAAASFADLLAQPDLTVVRLGRMDEAALGALMADLLAIEAPPEAFVRFLSQQSEGNPFFVAEYLRTALTEGLIRRVGSRSLEVGAGAEGSLEALQALPFPATLRDVVSRRFSGLSAAAQVRVELAAIIGRELDIDIIDAAGRVDDAATTELLAHQILEQAGPGALRFTHDKLRELAYARIDADRRDQLHVVVAQAIERVWSGRPDFLAASGVLAHHYLAAGRPADALGYLEKAADHSLLVGAYREAIGFLEQCLQLAGAGGGPAHLLRTVRWRRLLSDASTGVGNLAARAANARSAIAAAGGSGRPSFIETPRAFAKLALRGLWPPRGLRAGRPDAQRGVDVELARAHRHLAVVHYFQNEAPQVVISLIAAVEHAERVGPSAELAGAYAELGGCFGFAGLNGAAERYLRRAIGIAAEIGDPAALAYAHMVCCLYSVSVGHWDDVRASADQCQSTCEQIGDHLNWGNAQIVRFWMHHFLNQQGSSAEAAAALLASGRKTANGQHVVWALSAAGVAELRGGRPREALARLEAALELHEENDQNNLVLTLGCAALARLRLGQVERARADALRVLAMVRLRSPTGHAILEGCSAVAEVLLLTAPPGELVPARQAVDCLRRYRGAFPIGSARHQLWAGTLRSLEGRPAAAKRAWARGLASARALAMSWDESLLERARGERH